MMWTHKGLEAFRINKEPPSRESIYAFSWHSDILIIAAGMIDYPAIYTSCADDQSLLIPHLWTARACVLYSLKEKRWVACNT